MDTWKERWQYMLNWVQSGRDNHNRASYHYLEHKNYNESMHSIYMRNVYNDVLMEMMRINKDGIPSIKFTKRD